MKTGISFLTILILLSSYSLKAHDTGSYQLAFKENKNQWNPVVKFSGQVPGGTIFLEQQGFTYRLLNGDDLKDIHPYPKGETRVVHGHVYKVDFLGSNASATLSTEGKSAFYCNYFIGNDVSKWASDVHEYQKVTYQNLYPNIDMSVYGKDFTLKYDLIVHPHGKAEAIQFRYRGMDNIYLKDGNLIIETSVGKVVEVKPYAYQIVNGTQKEVVCNYKLENDVLSFEFPKGYKKSADLIIDPTLIFSTYTGSSADEFGFTATYDNEGNMYLGGLVNGNLGQYPVSPGAFQQTFGGGSTADGIAYPCDISIMKLSSDGKNRIYATYLGGSNNETPHSLIVNSLGQLCIYGRTYSPNFPTTANAYRKTQYGGADITVTILSADGSSLIGSTYIGGSLADGVNYDPTESGLGNLKYNYADDARGEIITDRDNNIYVASCTNSSDFPITNGAYQSIIGGEQDGCVFKLSPDASSLIFSTYIGGSNDDAAYSMDLKPDRSVYVAGGTMSSNFPSANNGVNKNYLGGTFDGFLAHLSADGTTLLHSTFVGTSADDQTYFVKLDLSENVYVVGQSLGTYPVINAQYSVPKSGQYITKYNPQLSSIIYSTVFGNGNGKDNISPTAFLVDTCENVYVCGWGNNKLFQFIHTTDMTNMPLTDDAYQKTTDGTDFYIFVMRKDAESLLYGSYFGGSGAIEHVDGGTSRFDRKGIIYEAICAGCGGNSLTPTTPGVWSNTNNSPNCNALGFKMQLNRIITRIKDTTYYGCSPLTITFQNLSVDADSVYWYFDDGTHSNEINPTHTFTEARTYHIYLAGVNHATCNVYDTAKAVIKVIAQPSKPDFTISPANPFVKGTVEFQNQTTSGSTWLWVVDSVAISHDRDATQIYDTSGIHQVCLYVNKSEMCPDSVCKTFRVESKPAIDVPNAFSPNDDGRNDIFFVRGIGVAQLNLKIFNRWGQKVFETTDINIGWDGQYKGVPQEMDVYAWELNATLDDLNQTKVVRNGNVTLIR